MICYPVIYTRTFQCDYFSNFHVIPDFADANFLMPYIRSATTDMNPMNHQIKKIVVTDTEMCVFGIIGYARDIVDNSLLDCTSDNKGRAVYGFYGFAVKIDENLHSVPEFSKEDISEIYKRYIRPVWNDATQHTQFSVSSNLSEKAVYSNEELHEEFLWNESVNVFSADSDLYDVLLYKALTGDSVSYCSCITDYKALKKTPFNFVVTTPNNLNRLRNEPVIINESVINNEPPVEEIYAPVNEEKDFNLYGENPHISNYPSETTRDSEGTKKNRFVGEDTSFSEESIPEEEIKSEIELILRKYVAPAIAASVASFATVAIVIYLSYIYKKKKAKEEKKGNQDAE